MERTKFLTKTGFNQSQLNVEYDKPEHDPKLVSTGRFREPWENKSTVPIFLRSDKEFAKAQQRLDEARNLKLKNEEFNRKAAWDI
jgi:hypothetical protein